ncbi:MAG: capsular polysaccharide synthesis protein [Victivallaceae bacterium]|nr:capsular polysaccharide synthesis protein [Victivallaceae bacterium]
MTVSRAKSLRQLLFRRLRETWAIGRYYSWRFAFYSLLWWTAFYLRGRGRYRLSRFALDGKTKYLDHFIETKYGDLVQKLLRSPSETTPAEPYRIWVFWGQGEKAMPLLVKACFEKLRKNHPEAVLVTTENLKDYLDLPPELFEKLSQKKITFAHFSDIVRMNLLAKHGGLWLDATVYVPERLPLETIRSLPVFTAGGCIYSDPSPDSVCFWTSRDLNWSTWCIGCRRKNHALFAFVGEMLLTVALREKCWPDYVFQDHLVYYAVRHLPGCREELQNAFSALPCENRVELAKWMDSPFDEKKYRDLTKNDFVFKLSFRVPWRSETEDGKTTFYGKLIAGKE